MKLEKLFKHFGIKVPRTLKVRHAIYAVTDEIANKAEGFGGMLFGAGIHIGDAYTDFKPGPGILPFLSGTKKKININEKASYLFTCGRDAFISSVEGDMPEGLVLVENERDEPIGLGEVRAKVVKNLMDIGDFLRRKSA